MRIDTQPIQAELQELAGNCQVKVKLDKKLDTASYIMQHDKGFDIKLNPNKFRSQQKLDHHVNICRLAMGD